MLSAAQSWNSTVIAEMLSASSNSVGLSILWERRYEISHNLFSTSKFHKPRWAGSTENVSTLGLSLCFILGRFILLLTLRPAPKTSEPVHCSAILQYSFRNMEMFLSKAWEGIAGGISGDGSFLQVGTYSEEHGLYHPLPTPVPHGKRTI